MKTKLLAVTGIWKCWSGLISVHPSLLPWLQGGLSLQPNFQKGGGGLDKTSTFRGGYWELNFLIYRHLIITLFLHKSLKLGRRLTKFSFSFENNESTTFYLYLKGALANFSPSNYAGADVVVKMHLRKIYAMAKSFYKNYTND